MIIITSQKMPTFDGGVASRADRWALRGRSRERVLRALDASPPSWNPAYPTVCLPPGPPLILGDDTRHVDFPVLPPDSHGFDDADGIGDHR